MKKNINHSTFNLENSSSVLLPNTPEIDIKKNHRCQHCNKLLGVEYLSRSTFDIKCVRCGLTNTILKDFDRQIMITDMNGVIIYINEQVVAATGYEPKEILGKTPIIWGGQMTKEFHKETWDQIAVQKKAVAVKVTNKRKNGELYPGILVISPIRDINGTLNFLLEWCL